MKTYRYVTALWDDATAAALDPVGRLVYRSNLLGSDQRITNTGGGNTSAKLTETDPLTGRPVDVLWIKGSGGDLRTSQRENFSSLYQEKLLALQPLYAGRKDKGLKSPAEDAMVGNYAQAVFNLNPRAPAQLPAGKADRPPAPQRHHRDRGLGPVRGIDPGDLRPGDGLRALDAARLRARARHAGGGAPQSRGPRDHDGLARVHRLGG